MGADGEEDSTLSDYEKAKETYLATPGVTGVSRNSAHVVTVYVEDDSVQIPHIPGFNVQKKVSGKVGPLK